MDLCTWSEVKVEVPSLLDCFVVLSESHLTIYVWTISLFHSLYSSIDLFGPPLMPHCLDYYCSFIESLKVR